MTAIRRPLSNGSAGTRASATTSRSDFLNLIQRHPGLLSLLLTGRKDHQPHRRRLAPLHPGHGPAQLGPPPAAPVAGAPRRDAFRRPATGTHARLPRGGGCCQAPCFSAMAVQPLGPALIAVVHRPFPAGMRGGPDAIGVQRHGQPPTALIGLAVCQTTVALL